METASYKLYVDWDNNGNFSGTYDDISAYILYPIDWRFGRNSDTDFDNGATFSVVLDNSTSIFSSFNSSSPIYGKALPNRPVKLTMTIGAGSEVTQFQGKLEAITPSPGPTVPTSKAVLTACGVITRISGTDTEIALAENQTTGTLMASFLEALGITSGNRTVGTGQSTLSKWWKKKGQSDIDAIRQLQAAELGRFREGKDGKAVFDDRAHIFNSPHSTAQATYGTGTLRMWNPRQEDYLPGIYNSYRGKVLTFNHSDDTLLVTLADVQANQGGTPLRIPAASGSPAAPGTLTVWFELPDDSPYVGVYDWTTVDYQAASSATADPDADLTANVSAVKTEYGPRLKVVYSNANPSDVYLVVHRAHGIAIVEEDSIDVRSDDLTSRDKYDRREYRIPSQWETDLTDAQAKADYVVSILKDPRPRLTFDVKANYDAAHLAEVQAREIGDCIHVHATVADFGLGVDADFIIDSLTHKVNKGGVHTMTVVCTQKPATSLAADGTIYDPITVPEGVPDDLTVASIDPAYHCTFGCEAWKNNANITGARFRAKYFAAKQADPVDLRTVAEGGTLVHDGVSEFVVDDLVANQYGAQYELDSVSPDSPSTGLSGYWYFAFQFKAPAGDSVWSDGNRTPRYVTDCLPTDAAAATGPPADWWVEVVPDQASHRVKVRASRPKTNGAKIWNIYAQIKDNRTGQWFPLSLEVYDGNNNAEVYYGYTDNVPNPPFVPPPDDDPGWINHTLTQDGRRLTRQSGSGLVGTYGGDHLVHLGDLVLLDRRASLFSESYCQWGTVDSIQGVKSGYNINTATFFDIKGRFRTEIVSDLRLLVVEPPWDWTASGYFGAQANKGWWAKSFIGKDEHGDTTTEVFESDWIDVPSSVPLSAIEARCWFDNGFSVSDNNLTHSTGLAGDTGNPSGASGLQILTHEDDVSIPHGQVALQFNRETANYLGIYAVAAVLSEALPAEGPYSAERTAHASCVIETGTCTVVKGDKSVTVVRSANSDAVGRIFLIYTADGTPDSDLEGEYVSAEGENLIELSKAFNKGGSFSYAIVKRWMDVATDETENLVYAQFTPMQCAGDIELEVWRTPSFGAPEEDFYATLYCRNKFGVGTRLTAGSASTPAVLVEQEGIPLTPSAGHVATDASLGRVFTIATGGSAVEIDNPTGLERTGQALLYIITGAGTITLGNKFNARGATLTRSSGRDMLGAVYNAPADMLDAWWSKDADA